MVRDDPRGVERSETADSATESTPDEHADGLHRLIAALDAGPVDLFATSGGAVNALALVARHPEQVRTLVVHEPPAAQVTPTARRRSPHPVTSTTRTCERAWGPGMTKFIALVSTRTDPLLGQNILSITHYQFAFDGLNAASTRIVIAAGSESDGELASRAAGVVAERLGTTPVTFPGGHTGFIGGELLGGELLGCACLERIMQPCSHLLRTWPGHPSRPRHPALNSRLVARNSPEAQRVSV